jgi:hypothetical protein
VAFIKGILFIVLRHFPRNKKHTNFKRTFYFDIHQKLNKKKLKRTSLYKTKLIHFHNFNERSPFRSYASNKKGARGIVLMVSMAILISFSCSRVPLFTYISHVTPRKTSKAKFHVQMKEFFNF